MLLSEGYYGWAELSSGKIVYIHPPPVSAEEAGKALKKIFEKLQEWNNLK